MAVVEKAGEFDLSESSLGEEVEDDELDVWLG
jgi:hypothetical protein